MGDHGTDSRQRCWGVQVKLGWTASVQQRGGARLGVGGCVEG